MGDLADEFASVYRDYNDDGTPSSGHRKPPKDEIRPLGQSIEDKYDVGNIVLRNGTSLTDAEYNRDALQDAITGGVSTIRIAVDEFLVEGGLEIDGVAIQFVARTGMRQGSPSRRPVLRQREGATDHLFHMSDDPDGRVVFDGMDLRGAHQADYLTAAVTPTCGFFSEGCATSTRSAIRFRNTIVRYFRGSAVEIGQYRHNWITELQSIFTDCGGYGLKSIGNEDVWVQPGSEFGNTGKTALYIDGEAGGFRGNIRIRGADLYRGGLAFAGGDVVDACNLHLGGRITNAIVIGIDCLGAYGHGIMLNGSATASVGQSNHIFSGVRFNANSRYASGTYSDYYHGAGHASLIGCIHTPYETAPPSLAKYLVEIGGASLATDRVQVIAPQWAAPIPSPPYAGSYITSRTNVSPKVSWVDDTLLSLPTGLRQVMAGISDSGASFLELYGAGGAILFQILASGTHRWGDGTNAHDITLSREAANVLALGTSDSLKALSGGSFISRSPNGTDYHMWFDDSGNLRRGTSRPTSPNTDGTVIAP